MYIRENQLPTVNVYTGHPAVMLTIFFSKLNDILAMVKDNKSIIYILVDFNLDLTKHNDNHVFEFISLMYSFSHFPLITKLTKPHYLTIFRYHTLKQARVVILLIPIKLITSQLFHSQWLILQYNIILYPRTGEQSTKLH